MVWNPGDGDDINEGGDGSDTVEVNGGGKEQFEVEPSATPGRARSTRHRADAPRLPSASTSAHPSSST